MKIAVYQLTAVTLVKWYTAGGLGTNGAIALCIEIQGYVRSAWRQPGVCELTILCRAWR